MFPVVLCLFVLLWPITEGAYPQNDYQHSLQRDQLIEDEKAFAFKTITLNEDENIVNRYLQYLKWAEFNTTKDAFPPSRPIEEQLEQITNSEVYRVLRKFPKGGNMHLHEYHSVSKKLLLDILYNSEDFEYLYISPENSSYPWALNFFVKPPENEAWEKIKGNPKYSKELILKHQTLLGVMTERAKRYPTDSGERWRLMNPLWGRMSGNVISNIKIRNKYLEAMFTTALDEGVQYIESRRSLGGKLYTLDYNATNGTGQVLLDVYDGELEINATINYTNSFIQTHPEFIGLRVISYGNRKTPKEIVDLDLEIILKFYKKFPNYISGHDIVGEEDNGNSLLFYLDNYLKLANTTSNESNMPAWFHTAETSWLDGFISNSNPEDPVATLQNTYEALILGTKRVGHGLGYIKHPYLLELLRQKQTAIETCPVSNQLLGFSPDLRNHPAVYYIRAGIPLVFGADDPGTFGYDNFTVDWYEAFMAWDIDLADMKQLAINSLNYSGLTDQEKFEAINFKWKPKWDEYIQNMKVEACNAKLDLHDPTFVKILPKQGSLQGGTLVHIYGRNFERAVCKTVICRFDDKETNGEYMTNQHVSCVAPSNPEQVPLQVKLSVSLDGGQTYIDTNMNYTYLHPSTMK